MAVVQVWRCGKCGKETETVLPASGVTCFDSSHSREMKLVEGDMPRPIKKRKKVVVEKPKVNPPYGSDNDGSVHGSDRPVVSDAVTPDHLKEILEDLSNGR